jgi:starch phosphorylase
MPVHPVVNAAGASIQVSVPLPGRTANARLWRVQVGRVPLFLLDSNVKDNDPIDRNLTARLYTSDLDLRISQEIILGIGGVRALRELGYNPTVWHMNEGHSAFFTLERIRELVAAGRSFEHALEKTRSTTTFTTHTPVPAGHDEFPLWLIDKYFSGYWPKLGLERDTFIDLARKEHPWGEVFNMSILAIRCSGRRNGVSELHGKTARSMWSYIWPKRSPEEIPIQHITNGIHTRTWIARRLRVLFDRYFDPDWLKRLDDPEMWNAIDRIPDAKLWSIRRHLKRKMVAYLRERARESWMTGKSHPVQAIASGLLLDPYALTIGFARRFATYKRAHLILRQPERLLDIINQPGRPVQVIFAGKAHPDDEPGKRLIQEVYRFVKRAENGGRLAFVDDYDMNLARYLLQGVDVWLNTPRRPNEASGTSGQKAAINGALNFSVLDGWWREGYNGTNGWAIGDDRDWEDPEEQDRNDAESLYATLENEIIPLYYTRSADNLPYEWLGWMKESICSLGPHFSMTRMVKEYLQDMYLPAMPEKERI